MTTFSFSSAARSIAIAVLLCGCMPTPPMQPIPFEAESVNASFGRTWDAVVDVFSHQNIPIKTIDRSSGLMATDAIAVDSTAWPMVDCGTGGGFTTFVPSTATYNVVVRGDSTRSTVRVNILWVSTALGAYAKSAVCSTRAVWETSLQRRIRDAAEKR